MIMQNKEDNKLGYVALLLHAHLPFVRNMESYISLEEKWLYEAITETYLPLIISWERLAKEGVDFKLNLSLSPTLISMLMDPRLNERYGRYLNNLRELAERERGRTFDDPLFYPVVSRYHQRFEEIHDYFNDYQGDLLAPLKRLKKQGFLEIITTCATHGYLPLMLNKEAWKAQVQVALDLFGEVFGELPIGMWLPECGYTPGVEKILEGEGIKYFVTSTHGLLQAKPKPKGAVYAPAKIKNSKVSVFGRDWETSHQVWSRTEGYPGDFSYREFYRDIGYDLDFAYLKPYLVGGIRGDTGLKYYRITGKTDYKEPYDWDAALAKAKEHASNFIFNREHQLAHWSKIVPEKPIVVAPYDAELFGHWWFEGPDWLEEVMRIAAQKTSKVGLTILSDYLEENQPKEEVSLSFSSWGEGGYNRVWLNSTNDWMYTHLHRSEKIMVDLAESCLSPTPLEERALNQACRELLLAQSSDWPFILNSQTTVDYAKKRFQGHLDNFNKIVKDYLNKTLKNDLISELETENKIFPQIDFRVFGANRKTPVKLTGINKNKPTVIMLSWEFPPKHVGGLGIHVRDLSEALVRQGVDVHVITLAPGERSFSKVEKGVGIHYLATYQQPEKEIDFLSWILQLNLVMTEFGRKLITFCQSNQIIIHAHDWLVAYAAQELKKAFNLPLIATIHATEYGRNKGLHNETNKAIHHIEQELVNKAEKVICCSRYMKEEVERLFKPALSKVKVIPNAVRPIDDITRTNNNHNILFVGRLVIEKGVQTLIEAFSRLVSFYPEARLTIAGDGPYGKELKNLVNSLGINNLVQFTGFVSEGERNQLLARSCMAVFPSLYEPFGIVALEAMAAGLPVIVSRTGGFADFVEDGLSGLFFEPGNVEDLTRCLVSIFQDPILAEKLSIYGQEKVMKEFTWEAVACQTLSLYQETKTRKDYMTAS
ncbi:MAG: hypothetical protein PWP31_927 [Clostridia bacterium]|nr:hypothetical protein [Clostridia bacterium]